MKQETPEECDPIIRRPPRAPLTRRRLLILWRDVRMIVLASFLAVGLGMLFLVGISILAFLPYELAHTKSPRAYPRLFLVFQQRHGRNADFLPAAIPPGATEVELDANTKSMFQASPFLRLGFRLGPADAAAELARLQALGPVFSDNPPSLPRVLRSDSAPTSTIRGLRFTPRTSRTWADAWHEPDTGWFYYSVSDD